MSPNTTNTELDNAGLCCNGHLRTEDNIYTAPDGIRRCRECYRLAAIRFRELNLEKRRANIRRSSKKMRQKPERKEYMLKCGKQHRINNPVKMLARNRLQSAVFRKKIIRPVKCDRCSIIDKIQGHHYDYDRAYDVMWLCVRCHAFMHYTKVGELL